MSDEVNIEQTEDEDTQCAEPESAKNSEASEPAEEKKDRKQKKEAAQLSRELEKALKELDKTRKDLEEERDRFIRLAADFDNYKNVVVSVGNEKFNLNSKRGYDYFGKK